MTDKDAYVIGVDFGTLSGRAVVVRVADGEEIASGEYEYPHAVMDTTLTAGDGQTLPPEWALQVPGDYVGVLRNAIPEAVRAAGVDAQQVIGVGIDFTACTVLPTRADGTPLCEEERFADRPHAYVKLWKHHAAQPHADRINALARERGETWLPRYGGLISSEWQFAKALQLLEEDREVYDATERWVEAADWIVWQLCGSYAPNACTAGYKGIYQDGSYPSEDFLAGLNPDFASFAQEKLPHEIRPLGANAGGLSAQAAAWTGLPEGIAVAVGNVDAHVTPPAADAAQPGQMTLIMGTSTCHVVTAEERHEVPGMCGVVDGGVVAGTYGYEAGQSGVGDIFGHFVATGVPAAYAAEAEKQGKNLHTYLTELAQQQPVGAHGLIALDWHNGNRSVLVDTELSGLVLGQTLATRPEDIYRALLEATAFGTRTIVEAFTSSGVPITELVVAGGLLKNHFLMQVYADVTGLPLSTIVSSQGPALGAAIHAAVAAGAYENVPQAGSAMGSRVVGAYQPDPQAKAAYDKLYAEYQALHDYFGRGGNDVMRRLKTIRREALTGAGEDGAAPALEAPEELA